MKILDLLARIIVGGLFIFSGLIKINDPIGTKIKLEEYFEVFSSDFAEFFHWFVPLALPIGMVLIILEVVLGVAVLVNFRMKLASKILLVLITFFTFLTFYSAYFNKVTDCGCFGDAIPLTPWESFYKDLILVVFIGYLFWRRNHFEPLLSARVGTYLISGTGVVTMLIGVIAIRHLPFIDFRPYKVGDNIEQNMQPEEDPIFEYIFEKDGEQVRSQQYLTEADGYKYVSYEVINADKTTPKIQDYNVWNQEDVDYTAQTFQGTKLMLLFHDMGTLNTTHLDEIRGLISGTDTQMEVIAFTSADAASFENFRHEYQLAVPYFFVDATVLKAMIRSNPGIILVKEGTVLGKWHHNDVPESGEVLSLARK